ncbi:hypothetical protein ACFX2J_042505 [Malus domestica]
MKGALTVLPSRRWKSCSFVADASNFSVQAPLKYNAFVKMSLVELSSDLGGSRSLIRPLVSFSAHEFTPDAT